MDEKAHIVGLRKDGTVGMAVQETVTRQVLIADCGHMCVRHVCAPDYRHGLRACSKRSEGPYFTVG